MARLHWLVPLLFLAMFTKEGESVRCWSCSSDLDPMCSDPFNNTTIPMDNCDDKIDPTYSYLTDSKTVCKKHIKRYPDGQQVVIRGCAWKSADDNSTRCPSQPNGRFVLTTFCETCEYDGCNGQSSIGKDEVPEEDGSRTTTNVTPTITTDSRVGNLDATESTNR